MPEPAERSPPPGLHSPGSGRLTSPSTGNGICRGRHLLSRSRLGARCADRAAGRRSGVRIHACLISGDILGVAGADAGAGSAPGIRGSIAASAAGASKTLPVFLITARLTFLGITTLNRIALACSPAICAFFVGPYTFGLRRRRETQANEGNCDNEKFGYF